jgi:hypothetical protein
MTNAGLGVDSAKIRLLGRGLTSLPAKVLHKYATEELKHKQYDDGFDPGEEYLTPASGDAMQYLVGFRSKNVPAGTIFPPNAIAVKGN